MAGQTWSQLPQELIELIVGRLSVPDCVHAWQLSRRWATAARQFATGAVIPQEDLIDSLRRLHEWRQLHPLLMLRIAFHLTPSWLRAGAVAKILKRAAQVSTRFACRDLATCRLTVNIQGYFTAGSSTRQLQA